MLIAARTDLSRMKMVIASAIKIVRHAQDLITITVILVPLVRRKTLVVF